MTGIKDHDDRAFRSASPSAPQRRPAARSVLHEMEDHWRELRAASGFLPRREDLDTARIATALPHAFILERAAPGVGRIRVGGRGVATLLGFEPKGLPLSVLFTQAARPELQRCVERCFAEPAVVDLPIEASQGALRQNLRARLLLLPMMDANGEVTRALGGLLAETVPRRSGLRFDISAVARRIETVDAPALDVRLAATEEAAAPAHAAGRPYLKLVVRND